MFAARTDALTKSWHAMLDELEASAKNFDASRKRDADAALKSMQAELDAADAGMKALKQAGSESWAALNRALAESRAAFDRANQTGRQQANASAGENSK